MVLSDNKETSLTEQEGGNRGGEDGATHFRTNRGKENIALLQLDILLWRTIVSVGEPLVHCPERVAQIFHEIHFPNSYIETMKGVPGISKIRGYFHFL